MPEKSTTSNKIVTRLKGLRTHLQEGEQPIFTIPGIWDNGQQQRSILCDIVLTNQRLFGYIYKTFPREHLFLDAIDISDIQQVSLRQKTHEPLFRELLIATRERRIYVRASRQKIEALSAVLHSVTGEISPLADEAHTEGASSAPTTTGIYSRQALRQPFESSPLAITLLFIGGLLIEIVGVWLWSITGSTQAGLPLCVAGFIAVVISIAQQRQRNRT